MSLATAPEVTPMLQLSTRQLADAAGITYRQADYWTRTGLIAPTGEPTPGSGNYRRWTPEDVRLARFVSCLMTPGPDRLTGSLLKIIEQVTPEPEGGWTGLLFVNRHTGELARSVLGRGQGWVVVDLGWCATFEIPDDRPSWLDVGPVAV